MSKRQLPLSALVIGSISPDIPYYLYLAPTSAPGHTAEGILTHCLFQSLLLYVLWRNWIKKPILNLIGAETSESPRWSLSFFGCISLAIAVGAVTHNAWDSMSHYNGWIVEHVPSLRSEILTLPVFKLIQYGGGVFGLIALAYWIMREFPDIGQQPVTSLKWKIALLVLTGCVLALSLLSFLIHGFSSVEQLIVNEAIAVLSGIFVGTVIYSTVDRCAPTSWWSAA